jgi:hypothetical protein
MDIVFNCPNCQQELVVDETAAGQEIECPSCGEMQTIPAESPVNAAAHAPPPPAAAKPDTKAAAPAEQRADHRAREAPHVLAVPMHDTPAESLVKKKAPEAAAAGATKKVRCHTIKRNLCVEVGHDNFDKVVSEFLQKAGEENIISITTVNFDAPDALGRMIADFGVVIIYRG